MGLYGKLHRKDQRGQEVRNPGESGERPGGDGHLDEREMRKGYSVLWLKPLTSGRAVSVDERDSSQTEENLSGRKKSGLRVKRLKSLWPWEVLKVSAFCM